MTNLEEFVLGGDPQDALDAPSPTIAHSSPGPFVFTFTPAIDNGAQLDIQISTNLSDWTTLATRDAAGGDWIRYSTILEVDVDAITGTVEMTMPADAITRFARLQITL